jgi:hypothetical protein
LTTSDISSEASPLSNKGNSHQISLCDTRNRNCATTHSLARVSAGSQDTSK